MTGSATPAVLIARECLGERGSRNVPIGPMTTYRVGGSAALMVRIDDVADVEMVAAAVRASGIEVLVVGLGSNLLVADRGFDGLVVVLGDPFSEVTVSGTTVRAGGAARLPVVARQVVAESLTGFEWAVGIPGSVGGAVRMNAGGHGSEIASVLSRVHLADLVSGEHGVVSAGSLDLGYRRSAVRPTQVVLWAEFDLVRGDRRAGEQRLSDIVRWRREHQPGGANAGSVFTNPPGDSAGRLIEASGAKGLRIGSAVVSTKHANFIQADEGGSADDVYELMMTVRERVHRATGVLLGYETRLVAFDEAESGAENTRSEVEGL